MRQPVKVIILDQEYLIRTDEDPEQVYRIAAYVNERLSEVRDHSERLSDKKIAILTALNIASEYFQLLEERKKLSTSIHERMQKIMVHIEDALDSSSSLEHPHNVTER